MKDKKEVKTTENSAKPVETKKEEPKAYNIVQAKMPANYKALLDKEYDLQKDSENGISEKRLFYGDVFVKAMTKIGRQMEAESKKETATNEIQSKSVFKTWHYILFGVLILLVVSVLVWIGITLSKNKNLRSALASAHSQLSALEIE